MRHNNDKDSPAAEYEAKAADSVDSTALVGVGMWDSSSNWLNIIFTAPAVWALLVIENEVRQRWVSILFGAWIGAYVTWIIYTLYISRLLKRTGKTPTE